MTTIKPGHSEPPVILSEAKNLFKIQLYRRKLGNGCGDLFIRRNVVAHLTIVELLISHQVKVTCTGKAEENGLFLSCLLALKRLIYGNPDGM